MKQNRLSNLNQKDSEKEMNLNQKELLAIESSKTGIIQNQKWIKAEATYTSKYNNCSEKMKLL